MAQLSDTTVNGGLVVSGNVSVPNKSISAGHIELSYSTPYIDFHHANSTADYSVRMITTGENALEIGGGHYGSIRINGTSGYFMPVTSLNYSLGGSDNRWYQVWVGTKGVDTSSLAELKSDITPFTSALDEIDKTDVYNYKYKEAIKREGDDIIHTGFVIGDEYNCSELLMGETKEGIELYSAIGVTFGGVKELYEKHKALEIKVNDLENRISELENKISSLAS